ncbi:MAG: hypothetical protein AB8G26_15330 [Ilumatobacter sp.]
MKPLAIWTVGVLVAFGALTGITVATRETERVLVVVDTSFQMGEALGRVPAELDRIDDRDYAEFALATVSRRSEVVHDYRAEFEWSRVEAVGPCEFDEIEMSPATSTADERILITTSANSCSLEALEGWTILEL